MKNIKFISFQLLIILIVSCTSTNNKQLDIQGHRGCRGLLPENTLSAFKKAIEIGVTTLEMDVVISLDSQVVVSHEPWFNFEITTTPAGTFLNESEGHALNLYKMNYAEISTYDVGKKNHPRFTEQLKKEEHKPLLSQVVEMAEECCKKNKRQNIRYNIEIKSSVQDEQAGYQPQVQLFCELVMKEVSKYKLGKQCTIQSFDTRVLNYMHLHFPEQELAYLVENNRDYTAAIKVLGFKPQIYSCDYTLLSKEAVDDLHQQNLRVIPWTVNLEKDINRMIYFGVDGIISDYPNKVIEAKNN